MSSGAECHFYEKSPGEWYYDLQQWPYGEWPEYDTYGPFGTWREARNHLGDNHANPGGHTVEALPGCPHDMVRHAYQDMSVCERCGRIATTEYFDNEGRV